MRKPITVTVVDPPSSVRFRTTAEVDEYVGKLLEENPSVDFEVTGKPDYEVMTEDIEANIEGTTNE